MSESAPVAGHWAAMMKFLQRETPPARPPTAIDWQGLWIALECRQDQLAALLYIDARTLRRYANGYATPSRRVLARLRELTYIPEFRQRLDAKRYLLPPSLMDDSA